MTPIKEANRPFDVGLQLLIKAKGLKQLYVAKKAGYTPQELSDMLNGRRLIKACDIPKLASAIGATMDEVYKVGEQTT